MNLVVSALMTRPVTNFGQSTGGDRKLFAGELMSIEKFIDEQVRRAIEAGEFDNLPGKGKPIDLRAYFETPEDLRLAYSILKSNNFVPEEVELLKEIEALKARLDSCTSDEQKERLKKEITDKTYTFNMLIEKRKR
jgi:hypothetical protein